MSDKCFLCLKFSPHQKTDLQVGEEEEEARGWICQECQKEKHGSLAIVTPVGEESAENYAFWEGFNSAEEMFHEGGSSLSQALKLKAVVVLDKFDEPKPFLWSMERKYDYLMRYIEGEIRYQLVPIFVGVDGITYVHKDWVYEELDDPEDWGDEFDLSLMGWIDESE